MPDDTYATWAWIEYTAPVPGRAYFDDMSLEVIGPATGEPTPLIVPTETHPARFGRAKPGMPAAKPAKPR